MSDETSTTVDAERETRICTAIAPPSGTGLRAAFQIAYLWGLGQTISIAFLEGDPHLQERVEAAARGWLNAGVNLRFVFTKDPANAQVRIAFAQGQGSWSYIGTDCRNHRGEPTMNFGWLTPASSDDDVRSVVLHEFGHMIGLIHEHQNPDRAIRWNRPAVIRDLSGPPNHWTEPVIQHNIFDVYDPKEVTGTPLDPKSIMMYRIPAAWTLDGFSTEFNGDLSATDVRTAARVYPT